VLQERASVGVLRGLLAVEAGQAREATRHFQQALALWGSEAAARAGPGPDFPGRPLAQRELALLRKGTATPSARP
jgi:hypothetical protein